MDIILTWICLTAALIGPTSAQNFQLLGNTVVDQDFFVIGELGPGETLQQFTRRYTQENPSAGVLSDGQAGLQGVALPRAPAAASSPEPLGLPSGATKMLGTINEGFSCEGLPYGYYADPTNDCRVYHVCNPLASPTGGSSLMYSFFCNDGLEFDQRLLTCVRGQTPGRTGCAFARQLYESSNSQFFRNVNFNEGVVSSPPAVGPPPVGDGSDNGVILIGVTGGVPVNSIQQGGAVSDLGSSVTGLDGSVFDQGGVSNLGGSLPDQGGVPNLGGPAIDQGSAVLGPELDQGGVGFDQGSSPLDEFGIGLLTGTDPGVASELDTGVAGDPASDAFDGAGLLDLRLGLPPRDDVAPGLGGFVGVV